MASFAGPNLTTDKLILCLDAANTNSYPGSGTTWYDLSGNERHGTLINEPTFQSHILVVSNLMELMIVFHLFQLMLKVYVSGEDYQVVLLILQR